MKLWIGEEREGYYLGLVTLFIGSKDVTFEEINNTVKINEIEQLYFGAGKCTLINQNVVVKCIKKYSSKIITMEVSIGDLHKYDIKLLKKVELIVTIDDKNFLLFDSLKRMTQIKLQSVNIKEKVLLMSDRGMFDRHSTRLLQGKTYKGDKVIK